MGNKKTIGIILLVVGLLLLVLSVTADMIGIGAQPGFGIRQTAGSIAGVIVAVVGLVLLTRK